MVDSLKKYAWVKIAFAILVACAGLATFILAIIAQCNGNAKAAAAIQYVAGVIFIVCGWAFAILGLADKKEEGFATLLGGAVLVAFGAYMCTGFGTAFITNVFGILLPFIVAGIGGALLLKGFVDGVCLKKDGKKACCVAAIGYVLLTLGIIFVCYYNVWGVNVTFMLLGLGLLAAGVFAIIRWVKVIRKA